MDRRATPRNHSPKLPTVADDPDHLASRTGCSGKEHQDHFRSENRNGGRSRSDRRAKGDKNSVIRLPGDLQAFVAIHLDDDQRKFLAAESVADVVPQLERLRQTGAAELEAWERKTGRKFTPPCPDDEKRADENRLEMR